MKLIILDEADQMTAAAQAALRRSIVSFFYLPNLSVCFLGCFSSESLVMEKYTKHVRFCLICNYVGKIIPGNIRTLMLARYQ